VVSEDSGGKGKDEMGYSRREKLEVPDTLIVANGAGFICIR
jgi:hypothetical protein